jgi:hypothetical protein
LALRAEVDKGNGIDAGVLVHGGLQKFVMSLNTETGARMRRINVASADNLARRRS